MNKPMFFSGIAIAITWEPPNTLVRFGRNTFLKGRKSMEMKCEAASQEMESCNEEPKILEEIQIEELAIDGICGVY